MGQEYPRALGSKAANAAAVAASVGACVLGHGVQPRPSTSLLQRHRQPWLALCTCRPAACLLPSACPNTCSGTTRLGHEPGQGRRSHPHQQHSRSHTAGALRSPTPSPTPRCPPRAPAAQHDALPLGPADLAVARARPHPRHGAAGHGPRAAGRLRGRVVPAGRAAGGRGGRGEPRARPHVRARALRPLPITWALRVRVA